MKQLEKKTLSTNPARAAFKLSNELIEILRSEQSLISGDLLRRIVQWRKLLVKFDAIADL